MASCRLHVGHKVVDPMSRKRLEQVATTGHWVVARPEPHQLVVPHLCACGQEHVAIAKRSLQARRAYPVWARPAAVERQVIPYLVATSVT